MEIFLRLYGLLSKIANFLLTPFLILIFGGLKKSERLPKIDSPILEICAVDLAEKIRNREVSGGVVKANEEEAEKAIKNQSKLKFINYRDSSGFICTGYPIAVVDKKAIKAPLNDYTAAL